MRGRHTHPEVFRDSTGRARPECGHNRALPREPIIKNIRILAAAALAGAAVLAHAADAAPAPGHHFQVGIDIGAVSLNKSSEFYPSAQITAGYRFNPNFAIEGVALTNLLFLRDGIDSNGPWEFEYFLGLRGVGYLPLDDHWELMGAAGAGEVEQSRNLSIDGPTRHRTDGQLAAGLIYRRNSHWSMGFEASTLVRTQTINLALRGEIHF